MPIQSTNHLTFTESEITEIYNYLPKILQPYILEVVITPNSLNSAKQITLMHQKNGNYWIIKTDNSRGLLFPKAGRIFNNHEYTILESIFDYQEFELGNKKDFWVSKAAKVAPSFIETEWTLEEKGFLEFGKASLLAQLEQVKEEKAEFLTQIATFQEEVEQLNIQLQESEHQCFQLREEINQLNSTRDEEQRLIEDYNNSNLSNWRQTLVSLTKESQEQLRRGANKLPILRKDESFFADYLVIQGEKGQYLIPKLDRSFKQHRIHLLKGLFEYHNYQTIERANKPKLVKLGKLLAISEKEWQLNENGILDFM